MSDRVSGIREMRDGYLKQIAANRELSVAPRETEGPKAPGIPPANHYPPIPSSLYGAALWYRNRCHWSVLPVQSNKRPLNTWDRFKRNLVSELELKVAFRSESLTTGVAVINGAISGGLICRDFDTREGYEAWKKANAKLARTLPTVSTPRGYHVYAKSSQHQCIKKTGDGELRGDGYNILPPSSNIEGAVYSWVIQPNPERLVEVDDAQLFGLMTCWTETTEKPEKTEITKQTEITEADECHEGEVPFAPRDTCEIGPAIEKVIRETLPQGPGQRNQCLFHLARRLRGIAGNADVDPRDFRSVVEQWHRLALRVIRTKEFEVTWLEFVEGFKKVKVPHGEDAVATALEKAQKAGTPPGVPPNLSTEVKLLAAICCELQRLHGEQPFFLSCRKAGELLGVPHSTANIYMRYLQLEKLIDEVEKGQIKVGGKASRYRYRGQIP